MLLLVGLTACGGAPADVPVAPAPTQASLEPTAEPSPTPAAAELTDAEAGQLTAAFAELEDRYDARLGLHAVDTGTGLEISHRPEERFAYASTHKALTAGAVLAAVGVDGLDEVITYGQDDLVSWSPVTELHVGAGLSVGELARAAVQESDNTAANLLLEVLGGPQGLDDDLTDLGDTTTEVVRTEPDLNEATPGDARDTSTPRALVETLRAYAVDDALPAAERDVLLEWLRGSVTGDDLIRAGAPEGWVVGSKSGAAGYGTRNDLAVVHPPEGAPVVIAVLSSRDGVDAGYDDALVAEAAEVALEVLSSHRAAG
ncbi:class A beta-lactamase [Actinotalea sp. BY-33]|uniref:Beta-lactamase n=1 Tax=Actinotalea soli TaxID=2819234 RepID=A0A939LNT2_9CELL|nr:class A beta-lactamase [Actinotalea soli]